MKSFLKYLLEILFIALIVCFGLQYFSDNGLKKLKGTKINDWQNIIEGKINSDVIINGSSRGYFMYNAKNIGELLNLSCFNIGFNAGGCNLQQSKFDIYLKKNRKPTVIIQNIDLSHFLKNTELPDEWQFTPFINNEIINSFVTKYDDKYKYLPYIPLLKYNQNFQLLKKGIIANFSSSVTKNDKTINGFSPQDRIFKIDYHNLERIKKDKYYFNEIDFRNEIKEMVYFYFRRLDKDAKVIFVWAPEHKLRCSLLFPEKGKILIDELNRIESNNKNFQFIDMRVNEISNHDEYYYDTYHLNATGADIFSKELAIKIKEILN